MADTNITAQQARDLLFYNHVTGDIVWRVHHRKKPIGTMAGTLHASSGYRRVRLCGEQHAAHRVAWLLAYGEWPSDHIDHLNGDRSDNRLSNLRCVSALVNNQNRQKAPSGSLSGLIGAQWHKGTGRWVAKIRAAGKQIHLGVFDRPEDAHDAYIKAKRALHPGCTI